MLFRFNQQTSNNNNSVLSLRGTLTVDQQNLLFSSLQLMLVVFGCFIMTASEKEQTWAEQWYKIFQMLGGGYLMGNIMQAPVNKFFRVSSHFMPDFLNNNHLYTEFKQVQAEYLLVKNYLNKEQQERIQECLDVMKSVCCDDLNSDALRSVTSIKEYIQCSLKLMPIPQSKKRRFI